jgi:type IV secretory pathway TraG/TraD family ATPase VirD4
MVMVAKLQMAAMSRVDTPEDQRHDFYMYVDEFQNFVTDSFASILSEARKYRLCLIIAHQYISQITRMNV